MFLTIVSYSSPIRRADSAAVLKLDSVTAAGWGVDSGAAVTGSETAPAVVVVVVVAGGVGCGGGAVVAGCAAGRVLLFIKR